MEHLSWEVPTVAGALPFWGAATPACTQAELDTCTYTCRHAGDECQNPVLFSEDRIPVLQPGSLLI